MSKKYLLFVFGTLMSGFGNHRLIDEEVFVDKAVTKDCFTMHSVGFPFISRSDESPTQIKGELYKVRESVLEGPVDALEGHPDWYKREEIEVTTEKGEVVKAWAYLNDDPYGTIVPDGDFRKFIGR